GQVVGRDPFDVEAWYAENTLGSYLASAVEMALWDLMGQATRQPLYRLLGGAVRKKVELAACMGIRPYDEAKAIARQYVDMGFAPENTKGARRAEEARKMLGGTRAAVGHGPKRRTPPTQASSPEVASPRARALERYTLKSFEQPMPQSLIGEAARLRRRT